MGIPHELTGLRLRELVADVTQLHAGERNAGALFQVTSQFNCLNRPGRLKQNRSIRDAFCEEYKRHPSELTLWQCFASGLSGAPGPAKK